MNAINGQISIGAPGSLKRYENANRICANCLERKPDNIEYLALAILDQPICIPGTCYVCEQDSTVACIQLTVA